MNRNWSCVRKYIHIYVYCIYRYRRCVCMPCPMPYVCCGFISEQMKWVFHLLLIFLCCECFFLSCCAVCTKDETRRRVSINRILWICYLNFCHSNRLHEYVHGWFELDDGWIASRCFSNGYTCVYVLCCGKLLGLAAQRAAIEWKNKQKMEGKDARQWWCWYIPICNLLILGDGNNSIVNRFLAWLFVNK